MDSVDDDGVSATGCRQGAKRRRYIWVDHFSSIGVDLEKVYVTLIGKLGYKKVKWAIGNKTT